MKMKWQFATIFAAIYAVSPVGAVEGVKGLTTEEVTRINAQLQPNHQRDTGATPPNGRAGTPAPAVVSSEQERIAADRLNRLGAGPLALLKMTAVQQQSNDPRRPKDPMAAGGVRPPQEKLPKNGKPTKRQKPSKRQAKSR